MSELDPLVHIDGHLVTPTTYGENPQQGSAGLYDTDAAVDDPLALSKFRLAEGTTPSFNNYADTDRLLQTVTHIAAGLDVNGMLEETPYIAAGAKHGNVCGVGVSDSPGEAAKNMLEGDLRAIFGGAVMLNFAIDAPVAEILARHKSDKKRLLDIMVAPSFDDAALERLGRKGGKLRALANTALGSLDAASLDTEKRTRPVRGGFLAQDNYTFVLDLEAPEVTKQGPEISENDKRMVVLAWAIGSTSNSNTITLVKDGKLIGNGVGQQDRVSAAELAIKRARDAGHDTTGSIAYSDSFFPMPDGPETLVQAGIRAIFTASGSIGDEAVFKTFTDGGVTAYSMPNNLCRGFYAH
jgi:phosphoribosylaminoimidazolecarboxamide formyltransferase/IMP cyclohydrolase